MLDTARYVLPLVVRDFIVGITASETFEDTLDHLARRRAALYANPRGVPPDHPYWTVLATALAPDASPQWMPMHGLIEQGITLEGGAKGFRGLFTKEPSEKERRRVAKTATLAARVMEIVAGSSGPPRPDEARLIAMAMASFGLGPEEITQTRPQGRPAFENIEIFGDLEVKTKRELLRGAWQLAFADKVDPQKELTVRAIAARLEVSAECDAIRAEVVTQMARHEETATVAVELARGPAKVLSPNIARPWLEHLVVSAAAPARRVSLLATALGPTPVKPELLPKLDSVRRRQAMALAFATLLGHDPSMSTALQFRADLRAVATMVGFSSDFMDGIAVVDRYLFERIRDATAPVETPASVPPPA